MILPTYKGNLSFECWFIDLLIWGRHILVMVVCPFSKWVEVGILPIKHSSTVGGWVHAELLCRYGLPQVIRLDCSAEFRGAFEVNLQDMGLCSQ